VKLDTAREDLTALEGSPLYQEIDWLKWTRKALEAAGVSADGANDALIGELADRLKRAMVESA
jgi:hypothetical protein